MKKTEINGHIVVTFNDPEELPMRRYQRFNKFLMIANEVGSTFEDFNQRDAKAYAFLKNGLFPEAMQELKNRSQCVYNAFMEYSPKGRAMAILVHSIDDKIYTGHSSSTIDEILDKLEEIGLSYKQSNEIVNEAKKKIEQALSKYFPEKFKGNKNTLFEYNSILVKKLLLEVKGILYGGLEELKTEIQDHEKKMLSLDTPNSWNVNATDNMEITMESDFDKYLFSISEHTNVDTEQITVFKFYALESYITEKLSKQPKQ